MVGMFEIDWTVVVGALGLLISLAAYWFVRDKRD
jgi:hypothetical protein